MPHKAESRKVYFGPDYHQLSFISLIANHRIVRLTGSAYPIHLPSRPDSSQEIAHGPICVKYLVTRIGIDTSSVVAPQHYAHET